MSSSNERFPSKYLKAADIDVDYEVTIASTETEMFKEDDGTQVKKTLVWFQELDKALMLNRTNDGLIVAQHGDDDAGWVGKTIVLSVEDVTYKGKVVPAIRVKRPARAVVPRKPLPAGKRLPASQAHAPQSETEAADAAADDNVPL